MINAVLCYISCGDDVLMMHRNKKKNDIHEGKWNGVGGKLESEESPDEALVREVFEETGITMDSFKMRGILTFPKFDGEKDWYVFLYEGFVTCKNISHCTEGSLEWKRWDQVWDLNLWEGDRYFLKELHASDQFFSGKFVYSDGKLQSYALKLY